MPVLIKFVVFQNYTPIIFEKYRRALIRRFPYAIFYEYLADTIYIYSIFHTAQNPDKWRQRLT